MNIFKGIRGILLNGILLALLIKVVLRSDKSDSFEYYMNITAIVFSAAILLMDIYDYRKKSH